MQDLVHTVWAYGQLAQVTGSSWQLSQQGRAFIDLLAAEVLKHAQSGRTRWDMDMRLLAECTQGFASVGHQSQQVQHLLGFIVRDVSWQLEQYSVIRLNVDIQHLATIAVAHADMIAQRSEQKMPPEVQSMMLAMANTLGLRCVQHLQEDNCHELHLGDVGVLLQAFARLGYRAIVVESMLQQLAKAAGCALTRTPEESSGSSSSKPADAAGLIGLLEGYVQLGYHPGEVLLLSSTVQLERQQQSLTGQEVERLACVLEACQFHSSIFSRASAS